MGITITNRRARNVREISCAIVSDAAGDATTETTAFSGCLIDRMIIKPSGDDVPSANWVLTVKGDGADLFAAGGADLANNVNLALAPTIGSTVINAIPVGGVLTITADAMGNATAAEVVITGTMP